MATTQDKIILELTVTDKQAKSIIADNAKEIRKLRDENKKLEKSFDENAEAITENNEKIKSMSRENASYSLLIQKNRQFIDSQTGSIEEQRAALSLLTAEYVKLSQEERESAKGIEMRDKIKGLSDALKENEQAIGDNRRSVGDYANKLKEGLKDLTFFGVRIGDVTDGLKEGAQGFKVVAKSIGGTRTAMILLTAVPIIAFLVGIIAFFKATDAGADKLEQAIDSLKTAFTVLFRSFSEYGAVLTDLFTGNITSVDQFTKRISAANQAVRDGASAALESAAAQIELTKALQDLEDTENALSVERAKADAQVRLALLSAKDRSKSEKERVALLKAAGETEAKVSKQELENSQKRLLLAQKEAFIKSGLTAMITDNLEQNEKLLNQLNEAGKVNDDLLVATQEAQKAYVDVYASTQEAQQKIANRNATLAQELSEQAQEARLRALEDDKAGIQKRLIEIEKGTEAELALKEQLLKKERDIELANTKLTQNQRAAIISQTELDIFNLRKDFFLKGLELEAINAQDALAETKKRQAEELAAKDKQNSELLLRDTAWIGESIRKLHEKNKAEYQIREDNKKEAIFIEETKYEALMSITDGIAALSDLLASNSGKQTAFQKGVALFQLTMDTVKSISGTIANAVQAAAAGGPAAPFLAATYIATGIATVLGAIKQAKQLLAVEPPSPPAFERVSKAAGGGNFITTRPTMLLVGDNPGGRERVTVEPLSGKGITKVDPGSGLIRLAGGGSVTADGGMITRQAAAPVVQGQDVGKQLMSALKGANFIVTAAELKNNDAINDINVKVGGQ